jgi:hypothetical protein
MTVPVFLTFQIPNPLLLSSTNIGLRLIEKKLKYMFKKKKAEKQLTEIPLKIT